MHWKLTHISNPWKCGKALKMFVLNDILPLNNRVFFDKLHCITFLNPQVFPVSHGYCKEQIK